MATSSETDEQGTTWTVTEDGGEAKIKRWHEWPHYLVTCRGVVRLVEGDDFGRAHDAALAAIRATRGEEQPEPQHATGEWWQVEPDVWTWIDGECSGTVCARRDGRWSWSLTGEREQWGAGGECATRDEAMAAAEAAARCGSPRAAAEWRQIDGGHWVREVGGLRVEVHRRLSGIWWTATALLSRCGHADVCVVTQNVLHGDSYVAREDADEWLRARGVL